MTSSVIAVAPQLARSLVFSLNQEINAVERDAAVVADDAAAAIGIRQAGDDLIVARLLHLRGVGHG